MSHRIAVTCVWCKKNNQGLCKLSGIGLTCQVSAEESPHNDAPVVRVTLCLTCHEAREDFSMPCPHCGEVAD